MERLSSDDQDELFELGEAAFERLDRVDDDVSRLPLELAAFVRVYAAQGVIDNGGYPYFFEQDWPGRPSYREFVSAYEAIGCKGQAAELDRIVDTFGFEDPHLHRELRTAFLEEHLDEETSEVQLWGDALCGDERVWVALLEHARQHRALFES